MKRTLKKVALASFREKGKMRRAKDSKDRRGKLQNIQLTDERPPEVYAEQLQETGQAIFRSTP